MAFKFFHASDFSSAPAAICFTREMSWSSEASTGLVTPLFSIAVAFNACLGWDEQLWELVKTSATVMARACHCRFVNCIVFVLLILITHSVTSLLFRLEADLPAGLARQAVSLADYSDF